jgi:hypothetical protein
MSGGSEMSFEIDIDRIGDWEAAIERWEWGDPEPLAAFVLQWGVVGEEERKEVARMLTTRPDPRQKRKPSSERMFEDLDKYREQRRWMQEDFLPHLAQWVKRLKRKLEARGWSEGRIRLELTRRNYLEKPKLPTLNEIYGLVADRHRISPEAVLQARKRRKRSKAGG